MDQITLYYRQGSSDKVYHATIEAKDAGYVVNFAYGRRGATMQTGTKTSAAVSYDAAKAIFSKIVQEKQAKGYSPGEDGTLYLHTDKADQDSGIRCQLLNAIGDDEAEKMIVAPKYWMQEKHDGRRMLIRKEGEGITGINRLGLKVALPKVMHDDAARCPVNFMIDGEAVGDVLHAFDLLTVDRDDLRAQPYSERSERLQSLLESFARSSIKAVETARNTTEKRRAFDECRTRGGEGVVFKKIDEPYTAGRPASGGPALKFKFHETASFIVTVINAKRSVSLALLDGGKSVPAGNVTIPVNHEIPGAGATVEVRYLYAFKESGCIYQPVYLGRREDIPREECTVDQLKYKAAIAP